MAERGEQPESQFNARADNAALRLRQGLMQQGRQMPERASVEVGPDGKPPAPPPPEGSYARMAQDRMRSDDRQQQVTMPADERPLRVEEVALAQPEPPAPPPQAPPTQERQPEQLSDNANRRIKDLVDEIRRKDQEYQQAVAQAKQRDDALAELQSKLNAIQTQYEQMVQSNLENLDPETRMAVMQDARLSQALDNMERRIMKTIMPKLQQFEKRDQRSEMERLASKYPRFDIEVHGPLIDMFRGKNPSCTIEQAFKAVASDEELYQEASASAAVVPPVIPPGNGRSAQPRYMPTQEETSNPEEELVEEAQRLKKLATQVDPSDRRNLDRQWHEHLKKRLNL